MDKFKELREKIEKREEELREELRPFAIKKAKRELRDKYMKGELNVPDNELIEALDNPKEEAINDRLELMISRIKGMLTKISKLEKVSSLEELLEIVCLDDEKLLKMWRDYLDEKGHQATYKLLMMLQYMPEDDVPEDVRELQGKYTKMVSEKAEELEKKEEE